MKLSKLLNFKIAIFGVEFLTLTAIEFWKKMYKMSFKNFYRTFRAIRRTRLQAASFQFLEKLRQKDIISPCACGPR